MRPCVPTIRILGVPLAGIGPKVALTQIERLCAEATPALIAYANAHTLNLAARDPFYREVLRGAALILNDGAGVSLAARMHGRRFPANLNGSDFTPLLLGLAARKGWRVYFLGGRPGVAGEAARRLEQRIPGLVVAGTQHGFFLQEETEAVLARIRGAHADLLIVGMGNPFQELWLARHLPSTGARLGVGVGAFLDFAAGAVPRAPGWMNRCGVEWLFRLYQEPRRMWRRYVVGIPAFLARVCGERLRVAARVPRTS